MASKSPTQPTPPPPPPPVNPLNKVPRAVRNLKTKTQDPFFRPSPSEQKPPAGPYFFYGSLLDPNILREILSLDREPSLRPASLTGYECKLWGQYPALLEKAGGEVQGAVYDVGSPEDAAKLARYQTSSYRPVGCEMVFLDGKVPARGAGFVFLFVGNPRDLSEGMFDLEAWMGRRGGSLR